MVVTLPANQVTLPPGRGTPEPAARTCIISSELGPADRQALLDLFARSSPETRRDRFHHVLSVFLQLYLDEILGVSIPLEDLAADPDADLRAGSRR